MCVVNGDHLVETVDHLLKTLFDQVVYPSEYIHSAIILYTNQYYHSSNKMKRTFELYKRYCHIHLTCMSVHYERNCMY